MRAGIVIGLVCAVVLALVGTATAEIKPRKLTQSQAAILDHGFKAKIQNQGRKSRRVRVKLKTNTFDDPAWAKIGKSKRVRLRPHASKSVKVKLGASALDSIASCTGRQLRVWVAGTGRARDLQRDTPGCAPKPIDLSRAADCDFIGQQQGSLCLLPFPDDYYTTPDPSTATGRRIDFHAAAMPANAGGTPIDPAPYLATTASAPGRESSSRCRGWTPRLRSNRPGPVRSTSGPLLGARRARRGDRCGDGPATADLGRDRLEREHPGGHRPRDPPGGELRLRASLHRRPAQPQGRRRPADRRAGGLPLLPRPASLERRPDQRPALPLRVDLHDIAQRRDPSLEPLPRLGLHRRQRREHRRARAAHSQ